MRRYGIDIFRASTRLFAPGLILLLSACASFDGLPEPVLAPDATAKLATSGDYSLDNALAKARSSDSDDIKQSYRNAFIAIQIAAIDARYMDFRAKLSRQMKGANFGFDLGVLALTSAGSFAAERTANILSAGAAALTGSKASLSKEVYFERTLPALIASMDARRLTEKTDIIAKMRNKQYADYTIAEAIVDLSAYQQAASVDGAIEQVTTSAAAERQQAQQAYDNLVETCTPEEGVGAYWKRVREKLNSLDPEKAEADLDSVSAVVGTAKAASFDAQKGFVLDALVNRYCTKAAASALIDKLNLQTKVAF